MPHTATWVAIRSRLRSPPEHPVVLVDGEGWPIGPIRSVHSIGPSMDEVHREYPHQRVLIEPVQWAGPESRPMELAETVQYCRIQGLPLHNINTVRNFPSPLYDASNAPYRGGSPPIVPSGTVYWTFAPEVDTLPSSPVLTTHSPVARPPPLIPSSHLPPIPNPQHRIFQRKYPYY